MIIVSYNNNYDDDYYTVKTLCLSIIQNIFTIIERCRCEKSNCQ